MTKKNLKSLKLNKKIVSNFNELAGGQAGTCEGPCKGGTGCCNGSEDDLCEIARSGTMHPGVCECFP
jgi:hypothetical protein